MSREFLAYGLISALGLSAAIWGTIALRAHSRRKLRRRGIKRHGH